MKLGVSQKVITPSLDRPVFLSGFGQNRLATSVHDDLYARALALSDGDTSLVICAVDLIGFFRNDVTRVIRRVQSTVPESEVIIAATHTHHGPDTMGIYGPDQATSGVDSLYIENLIDAVTATILESLSLPHLIGGVKYTATHVPEVVKNARDPEVVDDELTILQFLDSRASPLATLMNFPCHPEVLFDQNTHITADYPGVLRLKVELRTGAPCIFISGSLGGMMTPDVRDHSFEEAETMGARLADAGLNALDGVNAVPLSKISVRREVFKTRLTNILFKVAIRRGLLPDPRDNRGRVETETNLVKIDDCWLVTVPGELLPRLGLEIKAMLRDAGAQVTGVIGLGNDELGYILPKEDFRYPLTPLKPGSHYEETMSISRNIGPHLMEAVGKIIG